LNKEAGNVLKYKHVPIERQNTCNMKAKVVLAATEASGRASESTASRNYRKQSYWHSAYISESINVKVHNVYHGK
jgi:hypothetical protein